MPQDDLCKAIKEMRRVEFIHQDVKCSVDPYILYKHVDTGQILLDGIQSTRPNQFSTFRVANITAVTLKERFKPIVIDSGASRYKKTIRLVEP